MTRPDERGPSGAVEPVDNRPGLLATYCDHEVNTNLDGGWLLCQGCGLRYRRCPSCERIDPYHEMGCIDPLVFEEPPR